VAKVLFLHGWTSRPGGVKPTYLAQHGHTVLNPAIPDEDFETRRCGIPRCAARRHRKRLPMRFITRSVMTTRLANGMNSVLRPKTRVNARAFPIRLV